MDMRFYRSLFLICLIFILLPGISQGEGDIGFPFLKIGIGARQAGMGGVFTGIGDDIQTLYLNPGGLGHIRRWQWSATYNRWFADVYQATIAYVKQVRAFGSRKTTLGLSCAYLGMPSWDATGGERASVSANHILAGISLGQRLDWISKALAIGVNVRMLSSHLDVYSETGLTTDIGFLIRPNRFKLGSLGFGVFDYGVLSFGAAVLHVGRGIQFDTEESSLPRTLRAGVSYKMGRYQGWSLLFASDVISVRDRDITVGIGAEVWWKELLGLRMGYHVNEEDLGGFSFGFGLRWKGIMNSLFGLPSRYGDVFELNVADVSYGDVLKQTYRGTLDHYPVAPEPFRLEEPEVVTSQILGDESVVSLEWEKATDPDPFDEVGYLVIVDRNHQRIEQAIHMLERDMDAFMATSLKDSLMACEFVPSTSYVTAVTEGGVYYWAVVAYDLGRHAQLAKRGEERVGEFVVATPDLFVRVFDFKPNYWITNTPEQGVLTFVVTNKGSVNSEAFRFLVHDSFVHENGVIDTLSKLLLEAEIPELVVGQDTTFQIEWDTHLNGLHQIIMEVDPEFRMRELNRANNLRKEFVLSVPKGIVSSPDSVEVMATGYDNTEIPIVPEVYFAPHSDFVNASYYTESNGSPGILTALAERLQQNPDVTLAVMGSIDDLSGEKDPALAFNRADNVRTRLIAMGVPESQLVVQRDHSRKILGRRRRPVDPQDAEWIMEQNRMVGFSVPQLYEAEIFGPYKVAVDTTLRNGGIPFHMNIYSPGQVKDWSVQCTPGEVSATEEGLAYGDSLSGDMLWRGRDRNGNLVPRNRYYSYTVVLTDTMDRTFGTPHRSVFLKEKRTLRKWEMFGAAKFAQVEPIYQFYWDRLMAIGNELIQNPNMRVRFEGHACAIGSEAINQKLSLRRARSFTDAFKTRIKKFYPDNYLDVWDRIDSPVGFGENLPLTLKMTGRGDVLLGDNQSPVGRYLNRRIMVLLYSEN